MTDALGPIVYVVALILIAAVVLWLVERLAKLIGGRNTWLLLIGGIPLAFSLLYSFHNWDLLSWWQRLLYPLAGPFLATVLLLLGFAAVNPADAVLLVGGGLRRAWRWVAGKGGSTL